MEERLNQMNAILQSMQQTLQCNICLDLLNNPLTTKCGHSFCAQCIQQVVKGPRGSAQCPLCLTHITRRSLGQNNKISGLVVAVRKIIDSIKKDCCFEVTPSKYRPRPHPITTAEDDNSENEENDEPRRGTRKRGVTNHYNPEVHIPKPRARPAKQRILTSHGGQELSLHTDGKPQTVGADVRLSNCNEHIFVNAISKEHSYSSPTKQEPLEKPSLVPSFSRGKGNRSTGMLRGRSRLAGSGRRGSSVSMMGKYAKDSGKPHTTFLGKKAINSKTGGGLLSVSQQDENIEFFSKEGINDIGESSGNLSEKLGREKPADKVAKWLHNSSEVGFRIGASHSTDTTSATDSEPSQILNPAKRIALENLQGSIQTSEGNSTDSSTSTEKHINSNKASLSSKKSESSVASLSRPKKFFKSKNGKVSPEMENQSDQEEAETQIFDPVEYNSNTSYDPYNFIPSQKTPKSKKAPAKRVNRVKTRGRGAPCVSQGRVRGRSRGRGIPFNQEFVKTNDSVNTDFDINSSVLTQSTPISKGAKLIKNVNLSIIKPPDITTDLTQEKQLESVVVCTHDDDDDDDDNNNNNNDIPDSCPVITKDKFDILVSEAKENLTSDLSNISSLPVNHITDEEKEANVIFVTPAQAEEPNNVNCESKLQSKKGLKKRSINENDSENKANRKTKTRKKNISDSDSTSNTSAIKKSKEEKAREEVEALCSMFEDIEDHQLSIMSEKEVEKSKQTKEKERDNLFRENIFVMDQTFENTQLNKTILPTITKDKSIMPPPKAHMNNKRVRFNANTFLQLGGHDASEETSASSLSTKSAKICAGNNIAIKGSRNVRYASEMKSKLVDTSKSVAVSVNVKCAKSPGWSHVESARKDLKVRQTSLNITGGEQCNINDSRTEGGTCGHSLNTLTSSNETDVTIDEETQEFDVEYLASSQTKKDRVKKLKEIVSQLQKEEGKQRETKKFKVKLKRNNISQQISCNESNGNINDSEISHVFHVNKETGNNITDASQYSSSKLVLPNEAESFHIDKTSGNSPDKTASKKPSQVVSPLNEKVGQKIFPSQKCNKKEFNDNGKNIHSLSKLTRRTFSLTVNTQDLDVLHSASELIKESPSVRLHVGSSPTEEKKRHGNLDNCGEVHREATIQSAESIPHPPHYTMSPRLMSDLSSKITVSSSSDCCEVNTLDKRAHLSSQKSSEKNSSIDSQVGCEPKVVPFKYVGPLCSERCNKAGEDASLLASVGSFGHDLCLHTVPCEVYQVLMKYMALMATEKEKHKMCCSDTQISKTGKVIESAESDMISKNSVSHEKKLKGNPKHQECEAVAENLVECVIFEQNKTQTINELYEKPNADDSGVKHESISDKKILETMSTPEEPKSVPADEVVQEGSCPEKKNIRKSPEESSSDHDNEMVPSSYNTEDMVVILQMPSNVGVQTHPKGDIEFTSTVCEKRIGTVHVSAERSQKSSSTEKLIESQKIEKSNQVLNTDQTLTSEPHFQSSETLVDKCPVKNLINPTEISFCSQMQDTQSSQQSTSLLALSDVTENKSVLASKKVCPTENIVSMEGNPLDKNERRTQSQKIKEKAMVSRTLEIDEELVETEKENLESTNNFQQPAINRPRRKPLQSGQPVLENILTQVNKDDKKPPSEKEELNWIQSQISQETQKVITSQNRPTSSKPLFSTDSSTRPNKSQKGNILITECSAMGNKEVEVSDDDSPLKEPPNSLRCSLKRIHRPASSSSSSEDSDSEELINPPKRKPKVILSSSSNPSSSAQDTQKESEILKQHNLDSEEMRDLERLDKKVWDFFGHPEDLMNNRDDDQNSHISIDDDPSLPSDDEIPSTAEVLKNVNADMAIIKKMRDEKVKDPEVMIVSSPQETLPSASIPTLSSSTKILFTKVNKSLTKAEALLDHNTSLYENLTTLQEEKTEKTKNCTKPNELPSNYMNNQDTQALEVVGASDQETEDEIDNASHSSAYSSQNEAISTQKQKQVKDEVAMLKARVQELEAAMKKKNASEVGEKQPQLDVLPPSCLSIDSGDESEELFSSLPDLTEFKKLASLPSKSHTLKEKFVRSNTKGPPQLVCTGLNSSEMEKVQDLVNKLGTPGSSVKRSWGEDISHVVVKTEPNRLAQRTLKYLYGVAAGCWVISLQWVLDSLSSKKLLPEEDYEVLDCTGVPGPKRGRTSSVPLFKNCEFYIRPPFVDVTVKQLKELMELCGAQIVDSPVQFSQNKQSMKLVVAQVEKDHDAEEIFTRYKKVGVAHDWIIECIGMCAHICIAPYIIGNPDQSHLAASCLPQSLLEETQEL